MYQSIGEVYLRSILKQRSLPPSQTVTESHTVNLDYPLTTNVRTNLREIEIRGYTFNDAVKTRKEYITDLSALMKRSAAYNRVQIEDIDGYLQIPLIDVRNAQDEQNMFLIFAKILPFNEYVTHYIYRRNHHSHSHTNILPSYITMPFGVPLMEVCNKIKETIPSLPLCNIVTPEGNLPVFKYPDWKTPLNATTTGEVVPEDNVMGYDTIVLNAAAEYAEWVVLPGLEEFAGRVTYSINCKIRDTATQSINVNIKDHLGVSISNVNTTITSSTFIDIISPQLNIEPNNTYTIRITKTTDDAGQVVIAGMRMREASIRKVQFSTNAPNMNKGECKVYDTVTGNNVTKATWKRIYIHSAYKFTGHIVIENATMQWRINPAALWNATGVLTDRISTRVGKLYPYDFGTSKVDMTIVDIKPDNITLSFKMRDATNYKYVNVICNVSPLSMCFTVHPTMELTYNGWSVTFADNVSIGTLNDTISSIVMFTTTSSISMIPSKVIAPSYATNGYLTHANTTLSTPYTFIISILPRVTDNANKVYHNKNNTGADYYVDGEFIDTTKTICLSDYVMSLYESGLMVNMEITHR